MQIHNLKIDDEKLRSFCRLHAVVEMLFFGSIIREDFSDISDVDIIVNFPPGKGPGLIGFAGMELELSDLLGRQAHLHTDAMIHPYFRRRIRNSARVAYAA